MSADIAFSCKQHIGLVTLTRPQALNALNLSMIKALRQQLQLWQDDVTVHAVVVQAEEGKAFCAGGDVRWLYQAGLAKNPAQMDFFRHEYRLNYFIHQFKKPYISLLDGITMGGGVAISLHGSHPVATERFTFAMPETSIGFFPDIGASYLLARCPGQMGVYLGLTGYRVEANVARALKLIRYEIASTQIPILLQSLYNADLSLEAHQRVDSCLQQFEQPRKDALLENELSINTCFAPQTIEGIVTELQHCKEDWAQAVVGDLEKKAPLSLKVTLAQIRRAKSLSLADCLNMDYCLVKHFMKDSNFYEGVRSLLIDKDNSPDWQPKYVHEVAEHTVADYFKCTDAALEL